MLRAFPRCERCARARPLACVICMSACTHTERELNLAAFARSRSLAPCRRPTHIFNFHTRTQTAARTVLSASVEYEQRSEWDVFCSFSSVTLRSNRNHTHTYTLVHQSARQIINSLNTRTHPYASYKNQHRRADNIFYVRIIQHNEHTHTNREKKTQSVVNTNSTIQCNRVIEIGTTDLMQQISFSLSLLCLCAWQRTGFNKNIYKQFHNNFTRLQRAPSLICCRLNPT